MKKNIFQIDHTSNITYNFWIDRFNFWNRKIKLSPHRIVRYLEYEKASIARYSLNTLYMMKIALFAGIKRMLLEAEDFAGIHRYREVMASFRIVRQKMRVDEDDLLSEIEMGKLLKFSKLRNRHISIFLYATGVRVAELCSIKISDCRIDEEVVVILINGKGRKKRSILLPTEDFIKIRKAFPSYNFLFSTEKKNQYCTRQIQGIISRLGKSVLNRRLHPHLFRHTFITNQVKKGESAESIAQYVGNTARIIFEYYFHDKPDKRRILSNVPLLNFKQKETSKV